MSHIKISSRKDDAVFTKVHLLNLHNARTPRMDEDEKGRDYLKAFMVAPIAIIIVMGLLWGLWAINPI